MRNILTDSVGQDFKLHQNLPTIPNSEFIILNYKVGVFL